MQSLTTDLLHQVCPGTSPAVLSMFVEPLNAVAGERDIDTRRRMAGFLGQFCHETDGLRWLEEKLRYTTVDALLAATKARWNPLDADDAWGYLDQPERLANRIYADRMGNGGEASGDGWKYRGRGLPHLTGRANYGMAAMALGLTLLNEPDQLLMVGPAVRAGGWYWHQCKGNEYADAGDLETLTRAVNGGLNGLDSRQKYYERALAALA